MGRASLNDRRRGHTDGSAVRQETGHSQTRPDSPSFSGWFCLVFSTPRSSCGGAPKMLGFPWRAWPHAGCQFNRCFHFGGLAMGDQSQTGERETGLVLLLGWGIVGETSWWLRGGACVVPAEVCLYPTHHSFMIHESTAGVPARPAWTGQVRALAGQQPAQRTGTGYQSSGWSVGMVLLRGWRRKRKPEHKPPAPFQDMVNWPGWYTEIGIHMR